MQSTSPMHFSQRNILDRKWCGPPKIVLIHREPISKTIANPVKPGLNNFPRFSNNLGNKSTLNLDMFSGEKKVLKPNSLLGWLVS